MQVKGLKYHAVAQAFEGKLDRPVRRKLATKRVQVNQKAGGYEHDAEKAFNFQDLIRFERAYVQAMGNEGPAGTFNTLALAVIEGLNVLDVVTADKVVAHLVGEYQAGGEKKEDEVAELPLAPVGSRFENLRIHGRPLSLAECTADEPLQSRLLYSELEKPLGLKANGESRALFQHKKDVALPGVEIECTDKKFRVHIRRFGTLTLGDYVISKDKRTLTMIQFELGSPMYFRGYAAFGEGNGVTY